MNLKEISGYDLLVKAILSVKTEAECTALLEDLMTIKEINDMAQRMLVAKLLSEQTVYNKIVSLGGFFKIFSRADIWHPRFFEVFEGVQKTDFAEIVDMIICK